MTIVKDNPLDTSEITIEKVEYHRNGVCGEPFFVINFKCVIQHKNIQTQKTKDWPGSDFPKKYSYSKKNRGNPNHQIFKSFF